MTHTRTRTAIRVYASMLRATGFANTKKRGIVHHPNGSSTLWTWEGICVIDRTRDEIFIDNGISETQARKLLVAMLKAAIAERGLETKN